MHDWQEQEQNCRTIFEFAGEASWLLTPHSSSIFVEQYRLSTEDEERLAPNHAIVVAKFHFVFSTTGRKGIFGSSQGKRIAREWMKIQEELQFALLKVSFVSDHVHVALQSHPAVSPATIVATLMNAAQQVVLNELIQAGVDRLWMNSAYVGSYGDLAHAQIRKYMEKWKSSSKRECSTGQARGICSLSLDEAVSRSVRLHGTSPWHLFCETKKRE